MSIIGSNTLAGASGAGGAAGYTIERSLRFNDDDTAHLTRQGSAGNQKTWTWSGWIKRAEAGTSQRIIGSGDATASNGRTEVFFQGTSGTQGGELRFYSRDASSQISDEKTLAQFNDHSAWYHVIIAFDAGNSTQNDRVKFYVNGVEQSKTVTTATLNQNHTFNNTDPQYIGARYGANSPFDGYIADVHFIDGQALDETSFGEFDDNGVWQPKEYEGTYGTNGYHLDFSDNSSTSALGTDSSGNSNNWTANNFSVASGAGNDSLIDTPINYTASSGNNGGNYATLNALDAENATLSNGNLDVTIASGDIDNQAVSTIGVTSGKYYWETQVKGSGGTAMIGVADLSVSRDNRGWYNRGATWCMYQGNGAIWSGGTSSTAYGSSYSYDDIIGIALDMDNNTITWYINGTSQGAYTPTGMTGPIGAYLGNGTTTYQALYNINFGQRPFAYTPPTDHVSLCTANLPDPTIEDGSTAMDVSLYTGTGNTKTISGLNFSPDLVWTKGRSAAYGHAIYNAIRGPHKYLASSSTAAESDLSPNGLTSFNSDGWTESAVGGINVNNATYVGWAWDAGANSSKTFTVKVVSDNGNKFRFDDFGTSAVTLDLEEGSTYIFDQSHSSNATHPLRFSSTSDGTHGSGTEYTTGVTTTGTPGSAGAKTTIVVASGAPTLFYYCSAHSGMGGQANTNSTAGASNFDGTIQSTVRANTSAGFSIVKTEAENTGGTIGHGLNATPDFVIGKSRTLNVNWALWHQKLAGTTYFIPFTTGVQVSHAGVYNGFSSSTFTIGTAWGAASEKIFYCWTEVEGYSKFGSYTGGAGTFVYTGFRPRYILARAPSATSSWAIWDTARSTYNLVDDYLLADTDSSETSIGATGRYNILSNGFEVLSGTASETIYAAFAEHPFKTARAR